MAVYKGMGGGKVNRHAHGAEPDAILQVVYTAQGGFLRCSGEDAVQPAEVHNAVEHALSAYLGHLIGRRERI